MREMGGWTMGRTRTDIGGGTRRLVAFASEMVAVSVFKAVGSRVNLDQYRLNTEQDEIFTKILPGDHNGTGVRP